MTESFNINSILIKGLGGAGQRHLRILRERFNNAEIVCLRTIGKTPHLNPDFSINNKLTIQEKYNIKIVNNSVDAYKIKPQLVLICTPSIYHTKDILEAIENDADVIVEKPGAMSIAEAQLIKNKVLDKKKKLLVSYQRRFHPLVQRFKEKILLNSKEGLKKIVVNTNSYIPDWHPYENFLDLYACKASLGGGVVPTEIHEIDLILWIFGKPKKISSKIFNISKYNIDVEDSAYIQFDYDNFLAEINLCFFNKKQSRNIQIIYENEELELDLNAQTLVTRNREKHKFYDDRKTNDELFKDQLEFFLNKLTIDQNPYLSSLVLNASVIESRLKS